MDEAVRATGAPIRSLAQAAGYLEGLIDLERRPDFSPKRLDLRPIVALLERIGHPEACLSIVHVAGSKGKGSTCLFAESMLRALGERVGTFTSPHLESWTERFRVDGREVEGADLARAVEELRPAVDRLRGREPEIAPSFFDATTAAALVLFERAKVDRAILEVGLGGRLDSTNAVMPAVTCITSIELEHTDKLGHDLASIAREKAGIIKAGVTCVAGRLPEPAMKVVRERAAELAAPLLVLGEDFQALPSESLGVLGAHQVENASLALEAVRILRPSLDAEGEAALREGLRRARLPGRIELLGERPWRIVDSSHTRASAQALARALAGIPYVRGRLVLSVSAGKYLDAILAALLPRFERVVVTCAEPVRSLGADELGRAVSHAAPRLRVDVVPDPRSAVQESSRELPPDDLLCVAGSVYLAGIARPLLERT
jgi:dihydrofolate synthase/folylpolyglutamate synthase